MVATAVAIDDRPCAVRYPRGEGVGVEMPETPEPLEIGKGRIVRERGQNRTGGVAILSLGSRLQDSLTAADALAARGFPTTVADARFAKPIDEALVRELAADHDLLIVIEEAAIGGFGAHVLDFLARNDLMGGLAVRPMAMPDRFLDQDTPENQVAEAGLDDAAIVATALDALGVDSATSADDPAAGKDAPARA